ncbi:MULTISPECIES: SDR family NAD(P)-dependent oxidoreductase [Shewanella]|uniref:Oxidoreductase n=1 Tax=Shewanella japonica TaxID=93973 RepID=A0ABM6JGF9_9GAMM|nr:MULTISPECIES: SDR family NAD(P)-dependent oxidoreductase [Shewanella]ARD21254.1 oxidoreductase [Shewanella japonica]KPZ70302.1 Rhamnolipids biosynthesis 3-oxoacyl-[acyl-carrier-protein] reductase [Shewanella sp. P1-14-1]
MQKIILVTGSTDGIGLETAKMLLAEGHKVLLHGRNPNKLADVETLLINSSSAAQIETYVADLSSMSDVKKLAANIKEKHSKLDVLINNAGVYNPTTLITSDGLDSRYAVNTFAPYLLSKLLMPIMDNSGRIVNLSSAAQAAFLASDMAQPSQLSDSTVYAQSKLALTMWSRDLALSVQGHGPMIVSVNPASMLGSKMVKQAYGVAGGDLSIGADILTRAALSEEFAQATGQYFDNDRGQFASPHPDALDVAKTAKVVAVLERVLTELS